MYFSLWKSPPSKASIFWKASVNWLRLFKDKLSFIITINSGFLFYWDPWFGGRSLHELVPYINSCCHSILVKDVILGGSWSLPNCLQHFPFSNSSVIPIQSSSISCITWNGMLQTWWIGSFVLASGDCSHGSSLCCGFALVGGF
ncbi:hypothetical protein M5K25_024658 [Dendrobium thyrsiflorum]|uniref:Uncharacterized protein n=1 Tax=Dendrobium thyrsiflorum TaxID=117978 RepID=A0ABD0U2H9_DENTH